LRGGLAGFLRRHSRVLVPRPHRRTQPLQAEAGNAQKALETTIPGVLQMRPAPIDSALGRVRFSIAHTPHFVSGVLRAPGPYIIRARNHPQAGNLRPSHPSLMEKPRSDPDSLRLEPSDA
jgi:hypothetical protein